MSPNAYTTVFTLAKLPFLPTHITLSVCTVRNTQHLALVVQLVEAADLKLAQYGFESHQGHGYLGSFGTDI